MLKKFHASLLTGALIALASSAMADTKIGFVNTERIFRDAPPAMKAQKKLEKEFEKRTGELDRLDKQLKALQASLDKNGVTLAEADRRTKERELNDSFREFQRKKREYEEDLGQRRNEELASVLEQANRAIKSIADAEHYDIIFQEAVFASPRIDITEKVIKSLVDVPEKK